MAPLIWSKSIQASFLVITHFMSLYHICQFSKYCWTFSSLLYLLCVIYKQWSLQPSKIALASPKTSFLQKLCNQIPLASRSDSPILPSLADPQGGKPIVVRNSGRTLVLSLCLGNCLVDMGLISPKISVPLLPILLSSLSLNMGYLFLVNQHLLSRCSPASCTSGHRRDECMSSAILNQKPCNSDIWRYCCNCCKNCQNTPIWNHTIDSYVVQSVSTTSCSPISLHLCGPPYSLRHKNIEISFYWINPTVTSKYSRKRKSHISLIK